MVKLLMTLMPFFKEIFFDKKEEMDFSSYRFNIKKWLRYVLFISFFFGTFFFGYKSVTLSKSIIDVKKRLKKLEIVEQNESEMIKTLQDKILYIETNNKNLENKCLAMDGTPRIYNYVGPPKVKKPGIKK